MNICIIGCGAREHALGKSILKNNSSLIHYIGTSENYGLKLLCYNSLILKSYNKSIIHAYCSHYNIDIVIIGPEGPLKDGLVDYLSNDFFCIGPDQENAQIETSKIYARKLLENNELSHYNPDYISLHPVNTREYNINKFKRFYSKYDGEIVVKADGLHGGKGVKVFDKSIRQENVLRYIDEILQNEEEVLIEEKLIGNEYSFISLVDGAIIRHTFPIMDYKPVYNGNKGPNTGSMGCFTEKCSLSFLTDNDIDETSKINKKVSALLNYYNRNEYRGFLYGSFMKTKDGIKVIEFNCRLGDPEAITLCQHLMTDLTEVFTAMKKRLKIPNLQFYKYSSICKYIVPPCYPTSKIMENPYLDIGQITEEDEKTMFYGSFNGKRMLGSRTCAFITLYTDENHKVQEALLDKKIQKIKGDYHYRTDLTELYLKKLLTHTRTIINPTIDLSHMDNIILQINPEKEQIAQNINISNNKLTYKDCGVDIENVNISLNSAKKYITSTFNTSVVSDIGSFGGMYSLKKYMNIMTEPVLVSSTDGVGTKSEFVCQHLDHKTAFMQLGQDLVNHCINDILVQGAKPLFFLDYFASSKIHSDNLLYFIKGVSMSCNRYNCVLMGGETAEMPNVYNENAHDFVGTIIGIVDKKNIIDGKKYIREGDIVIAIPSSGPHTNGYSMIRRVFDGIELTEEDKKELCSVHRCYLNEVERIQKENIHIHGLCHITGGGLIDNPVRVLPDNLDISYTNFKMGDIFDSIQLIGDLSLREMKLVFNCGIGMMVFIDKTDKKNVLSLIDDAYELGTVVLK